MWGLRPRHFSVGGRRSDRDRSSASFAGDGSRGGLGGGLNNGRDGVSGGAYPTRGGGGGALKRSDLGPELLGFETLETTPEGLQIRLLVSR